MDIKVIKNSNLIWPHFLNFCRKSKPYPAFQAKGLILQEKVIKLYFNSFWRDCTVYQLSDGDRIIAFVFLSEKEYYFHVEFLFGLTKNSKPTEMVLGLHQLIDSLPKYFVSEIRRIEKVESYKKWIDRFDKRCIILSNDNETVFWSKMNKLEVIGTNPATEQLKGKKFSFRKSLNFDRNNSMNILEDDEENMYYLHVNNVSFQEDFLMINGFFADEDKTFAGYISFKFKP